MRMKDQNTMGPALIACARNAIVRRLGGVNVNALDHPALKLPGASFVTLYLNGELRGCIGSLHPTRSTLAEDVSHNAEAAAFEDPRFPPLDRSEWPFMTIEVSVLGPTTPMHFSSEIDLIEQLVPNKDGVILRYGPHQSTFLPSVWRHLRTPYEFLRALKLKAGLPVDFWDQAIRVERYAVDSYGEPEGKSS